jgi:transcriptional regulator with XRE-family HTH domain
MNASFGERLVSARKMAGLSLAALAEKTGNLVTRQSINKYEKGKMNPGSDALMALSHALGVKPDYFFRESNVALSDMEFRKKSRLSAKESESIKHRTLEFTSWG